MIDGTGQKLWGQRETQVFVSKDKVTFFNLGYICVTLVIFKKYTSFVGFGRIYQNVYT